MGLEKLCPEAMPRDNTKDIFESQSEALFFCCIHKMVGNVEMLVLVG